MLINTNDRAIQMYWPPLDEEENRLRNGFHWEWMLTALDPLSAGISLAFLWSSWLQTQMRHLHSTLWEELSVTQQIRKEGESEGAAHIPAVCHSSWSWRDREEKDLVDGLLEWAPVFLLCDRGPPLCSHVKTYWWQACNLAAVWLVPTGVSLTHH